MFNLGDSGRLQTNALTRKPPVVEALDLSIISIPSLIHLEQPFTLRLKYHNPTKIQTHILVSAQKSKMNSVLLMGSNSIDLGIIKSEEYVEFEMRFYPLMFGCCRIEGVKILDVLSGNMREIEVLAEIFVERN